MQDVEKVLLSIIPTRIEAIWGTITGVIGTMITFLFGVWNDALTALAMFVFIDYITGVMAAYIRPKKKLSSKKGFIGILKKLAVLTSVVFAHGIDLAVGQNVFATLVTYSLLGNEGLSIIENLSYCGVPIPISIKRKLEQYTCEKEGTSK